MGLMEDMQKEGVGFYKMNGNTMTFALKDLEVEATYKIFDTNATEKNMMWFMPGMMVTADDGTMLEVEKTETLKSAVFDKYFKGKRRVWQFTRNCIIDGKEQRFGFKRKANDILISLCQTLTATGQDPLKFKYTMTKSGEGLKTTYAINVSGKADDIVATPKQAPQIKLNMPQMNNTKITEQESELMNAYKNIKEQEYKTFDVFKGIYVDNKDELGIELSEARLQQLFNMC